jgi:phenylacetic acid degradation operon negative regulatory protein
MPYDEGPIVTDVEQESARPVRPQSAMLGFLGLYLRGRDVAVSIGSLVDVLDRLGVGEEAVRSTVTRMAERDLLSRHKVGRKVYVGLTRRSVAVLDEGHRRMWEQGAVLEDWDGTWTLVAFTLPDSRRSDRHDLRTRLQWAGFGPLQGGLWVAAGHHRVPEVLAPLDLDGHVAAFAGKGQPPSDASDVVRRAFELEPIARAYADFVTHWSSPTVAASLPDDLARQLLLHTEWLGALRRDPHLPLEHLPQGWPAVEAQRLFRTLARRWEAPAATLAAEVLDLVEAAPGRG